MKLNRFFYQYLAAVFFGVWTFVSYTPYSDSYANIIRAFGVLCIFFGVVGRIYATVFIGGMKNEGTDGTHFIDYGAYSLCRNPLYLFSFVAFVGILALKAQLILIVLGVVFYLCVYHFTIKNEEIFLKSKFGQNYEEYLQRIPRFFPKICKCAKFQCPDKIEVRPAFLHKELKRSVNWVGGLLILLVIEALHHYEILPNLYTLY